MWPNRLLTALTALFLLLASTFGSPADAAARVNWKRFHFDDASTGFNPLETIITPATVSTLTEAYRYRTGFSILHGAPAVSGGLIYLSGIDSRLFGRLFVYRDRACHRTTCPPLWTSQRNVGELNAPTVAGGRVFAVSSSLGRIFAWAAGGCGRPVCREEWSGAMPLGNLGTYPVVANGKVYAAGGRLVVWNAQGCGQPECPPLWTGDMDFDVSLEGGVTFANGTAFVIGQTGRLYAFRAMGCGQSTCRPLWTAMLGLGFGNDGSRYSAPAVANGVVYVGVTVLGIGTLAAFDARGCGRAECEPLWQGKREGAQFDSSPAVANGVVYIGSFPDSRLYAFNADGCGQAVCVPLWSGPTTDFPTASPIVAGGVVYVPDNTGHVNAFAAAGCGRASCDPIWVGNVSPGFEIAVTPAVVNGKLYVGSHDSFLHVLVPSGQD